LYIHCLQVVNMMRNLCVIVTKIAIGGLTSVREEIERGREGPKSEIGREIGRGRGTETGRETGKRRRKNTGINTTGLIRNHASISDQDQNL